MKLHLKFVIYFIFLLCLSNCKKQEKNITVKHEIVKVEIDTLLEFPSSLTKNRILGKFDYTKDSTFVLIPLEVSSKTTYLRKEVWIAFNALQNAAKKDSINFKIISGTRDFEHQKRIWNYKWNTKYKKISPLERAKKILQFSAMPSTSRHHWGTDLDLNNLTNNYFSSGQGLKEYNWLVKNASKFGFYQPYTSKENGRTGYNEEKWHWSYAPLSILYLEYYNKNINISDIDNFDGFEFAKDLNIISNYVNGVHSKLLK